MEAGSVCGNFLKARVLLQKQTANNSSMHNRTLLTTYIFTSYMQTTTTKFVYTDETWINTHHTNKYI